MKPKSHPKRRKSPGLWAMMLACALSAPSSSYAGKVDFLLGYYTLEATSTTRSGSHSGLGAYRLSYQHTIIRKFDLYAGYSITNSQIISGDKAFGFDLGIDYFPLTPAMPQKVEGEGYSMSFTDPWRPYLGVSFNQRQFQSVQSNYAGIGFRLGVEHSLSENMSLKADLQQLSLGASKTSSATIRTLLVGISLILH